MLDIHDWTGATGASASTSHTLSQLTSLAWPFRALLDLPRDLVGGLDGHPAVRAAVSRRRGLGNGWEHDPERVLQHVRARNESSLAVSGCASASVAQGGHLEVRTRLSAGG